MPLTLDDMKVMFARYLEMFEQGGPEKVRQVWDDKALQAWEEGLEALTLEELTELWATEKAPPRWS